MSAVLPWLLLAAVVTLLAAHVAIVIGLAKERAWTDALLALLVVPLAPYWAWRDGMKRRAYAWLAGVGLYALGVAIA